MKIYFSPFSPYVRKCLVAGHELGLNDRIRLLPSNAGPIQRDKELIAKNPLGKVPTFITDDGQVLYDSRVICEYLDDLAGGNLFPRTGSARWAALTLQSLGDGILDGALLARYEDVARPEALRWSEWRAGQLDKAETSLAHLDSHPEMLEGRVDIGSLTVACALWYLDLRFANFDWRSRHAGVASWFAKFSQRASLQGTWAL
ncbi:glutathione S-transferase [Variovorax sp. LjRoot290]|uniref:glutathione S-transferase family protein n=1 Tax=unclassified Variovorax TaxID=663243 RepID=UPI003ECF0EEF